jgi:hypothetical protein
MNQRELRQVETFLSGKSRKYKLNPRVNIQHFHRMEYANSGGHAISLMFGLSSQPGNLYQGEYQNQCLISSMEEAVMKVGIANQLDF